MEIFLPEFIKKLFLGSFKGKLSTKHRNIRLITQMPAFFVDNCYEKLFIFLYFDYGKAELLRIILGK